MKPLRLRCRYRGLLQTHHMIGHACNWRLYIYGWRSSIFCPKCSLINEMSELKQKYDKMCVRARVHMCVEQRV